MHRLQVAIRRKIMTLGFGVVAATITLGLVAAPSQALSRLPTQTSLTASTTTLTSSTQSVTITAGIRPDLLVVLGSVTFTDTTTNTVLGVEKPSIRCLLSFGPCLVSITVPGTSLAAGPNTITGAFSGDLIEGPSSGSIVITLALTSPVTMSTCPANSGYCTDSATSPDGSTGAHIQTTAATTGSTTISVSFTTAPLPCSGVPLEGDALNFSATNAGGGKVIDYYVYGAAADALAGQFGYYDAPVCYESSRSFTTVSGAPATRSGNQYYGLLPNCESDDDGDPPPPCVDYSAFYGGDGEGPDTYVAQIETDAADPHVTYG